MRTAERLGFEFEGVFRHHMIVKGQNRDTAWFSLLKERWSALSINYYKWLYENMIPYESLLHMNNSVQKIEISK